MWIWLIKRLGPAIALLVAVNPPAWSRTARTLVGSEVPQRFYIGTLRIFSESDSVYLNKRLLQRNTDYIFDEHRGSIDLSNLNVTGSDTLVVIYHELPPWLQRAYGRELPSTTPSAGDNNAQLRSMIQRHPPRASPGIAISGAKSFRFSARSAGSSDFSQSLDLQISGNLTPGLEITGSVSDRGYDPSYGPSNSRLSELERINLTLKSEVLSAQIGDMTVLSRFGAGQQRDKRVSGAAFNLHARHWYAEAMAARPQGRFETVTFMGQDGTQGPYQIGAGAGARPIVPGSEQVWLDGQLLARGAHKDYTVDYPTGQITFSVKHPIDQRSRIEVDYEPRATEYREELFSSGGGVLLGDSAVQVELAWLREGDDRNLPLTGELSRSDRELLAAVGDSVSAAVRSGVTTDSNGSYILMVDSLPDSVYRYVGPGEGDFTISFSSVGSGKGMYRFLGSNRFEYVGDGLGDYLPVIILPAAERTDYYDTRITVNNDIVGVLTAEVHQTQFDQNLFSIRDDHDNRGLFYAIGADKTWGWHERDNRVSVRGRRKEAEFKSRQRLYPADFGRRFLLPDNLASPADETLYELAADVSPVSFVTFSPSAAGLDHRNRFTSSLFGLTTTLFLRSNLESSIGWETTDATFDSLSARSKGEADTYTADITYRIYDDLQLTSSYERDIRENDYYGELKGTRYNRYRGVLGTGSERLSFEYYLEDSLIVEWDEILTRHGVAASSSRRLGLLTYSTDLVYQWLQRVETASEDFLGQLHVQYHDARQRLDVSSSYTLSEETRHERGISYLEVDPGQGQYIFENGEYIPDPDGNFIRVEEILSERSRVSRGEKSFHISKGFTTGQFRFTSTVQEELLDGGKRELWWAFPFLSDESQPYLFYLRRYNADIRLFPVKSVHVINVTVSDDRELREVAGSARDRHDSKGALTLKQVVARTCIEEGVELFRSDRDSYFNSGGRIDGFHVGLNFRQLFAEHEISTGGSFRRAESSRQERSEIYALQTGARLSVVKKGELRALLELYRQKLVNTVGFPSFLLTDNKSGKLGAIWSVSLRYGVKGGVRVNFSVNGRHADDRTARITGRGEMVAGF